MTAHTHLSTQLLQCKHLTHLGIVGQGIVKNNALIADSLGVRFECVRRHYPFGRCIRRLDALAGWGRKNSYYRAKQLADKYQKPLITLEDGFLRSIDSGVHSRYALSYIADDVGVYFDLTAPSHLENCIINNIQHWDNNKKATAQRLIAKILKHKLSKYNASLTAPDLSALANNDRPHVIIIDQVKNDKSITGAGASADSFFAMLQHAKANYPNYNIWIKAHPAGRGHFCMADLEHSLCYLTENCNPIALLEQVSVVYTVSSHMGFEALMLGKTVVSFGMAWYVGFGLTLDDNVPCDLKTQVDKRRQLLAYQDTPVQASLEQLFVSAYIDYSYYADPASAGIGRTACDIDTAINWLIYNQRHTLRLQGNGLSLDLSRWKGDFVRQFLDTPLTDLTIKPKSAWLGAMPNAIQHRLKNPKRPYQGKSYNFVVAWGLKHAQTLKDSTAYRHLPILCMEDGFIRSKGLGATLLPPLSVVLDGTGIYYNAKMPSDLESLLTCANPSDDELAQAQTLIDKLTAKRISKYNVGRPCNLQAQLDGIRQNQGKQCVRLVVGQVEDDASVQNCLSPITTNQALLTDVRQRYPDDVIIYKPHPDVEAGLRTGVVDDKTLALADIVAHDSAMPDCLDVCDVVHTISSLTGFEALIRGKQVVCYGLPFYAGFGLTCDVDNDNALYQAALARRQRPTPMNLLILAYITLIAYPLYCLPDGVGLATAQQVVDFLADDTAAINSPKPRRCATKFMQLRHRLQKRR